MTPNDFQRYLDAKRSVDDRALNLRVWQALRAAVTPLQASGVLSALELGCGTGSMLERLVAENILTRCRYTGIDADPANIDLASHQLPDRYQDANNPVSARYLAADAFEYLRHAGPRCHLVLAHAFLDLIDVPEILSLIRACTLPGGLWYFTINFDGLTILEPEIAPNFDQQVLECYHRTMDRHQVADGGTGGSRTGRKLFRWLPEAGARLIAAGASDWVVYPDDHAYPADEDVFLHHLIDTISRALHDHPELDQAQLAAWIAQRHCQVEHGELILIVHQLDFLAQLNT